MVLSKKKTGCNHRKTTPYTFRSAIIDKNSRVQFYPAYKLFIKTCFTHNLLIWKNYQA